jgi:acetyl-CoA acetyltransferase
VNIGRNAALAAGFPETVCGTSVDRQCGSSQQALHFAAQGVIAGAYDVVIAAGVESMSRVPMGTSVAVGGAPFGPTMNARYQDATLYSSQITDGAAAVLVMTKEKAKELGLRPRARFHAFALGGVDPVIMLTAPIPATKNVLARAGMKLRDIDVVEINEAFAPVILAWQHELDPDMEKVNMNGGAIALGHPLGCSGARLMTTLVNLLERTKGRWGLQTMCEGGGMANATIIERL